MYLIRASIMASGNNVGFMAVWWDPKIADSNQYNTCFALQNDFNTWI